MLVGQFCALRIATPDDCACAATALKPLICSRIASTSSGLSEGGLSPPPPGPMRWPGRTISRLDPRLEICSFTAAVAGQRIAHIGGAVHQRLCRIVGQDCVEHPRSEERRGGKECVSTGRSRGAPYQ